MYGERGCPTFENDHGVITAVLWVNINSGSLFTGPRCCRRLAFPQTRIIIKMSVREADLVIIAAISAGYLHSWLYIKVKGIGDALNRGAEKTAVTWDSTRRP